MDKTTLGKLIAEHYNTEELRTLCFDLGVDYDDLVCEGKSAKARELISLLERHESSLDRLIQILQHDRPDAFAVEQVRVESQESIFSDWEGVFRIPPKPPARFTDRKDEIQQFMKRLQDPCDRLIRVVGPAGVGKAALIAKVCQMIHEGQLKSQDQADATIADKGKWVNCSDLIEQPTRLFDNLANLLSDAYRKGFKLKWRQQHGPHLPADFFEDLVCGYCERHCIIVLDDLDEILTDKGTFRHPVHRDFFNWFAMAGPALRIITISRKPPRFEKEGYFDAPYDLEGLSLKNSVIFLKNIVRKEHLGKVNEEELWACARRTKGAPDYLKNCAEQFGRRPPLYKQREHVLQALAVLDRWVPLETIRYVLEWEQPIRDLKTVLTDLKRDSIIDYNKETKSWGGLSSLKRDQVYKEIPETGKVCKQALHHRVADYYAEKLSSYDPTVSEPGSYMSWYRLENNEWQECIAEWLEHLSKANDLDNAYLSIANLYFNAFWWWGCYIPFPLCDEIVRILKGTDSLKNRTFANLLEQLHRSWPHERYYKERAERKECWRQVKDALVRLRRLLGCEGELSRLEDDGERLGVRMLLDSFLGDALRFLGEPDTELYYDEAYRIAKALDEYQWCTSYILCDLSDLWAERGHYDLALEKAKQGWDEITDEGDHEIRSNILRVLSDIHWRQGDFQRAWKAYELAIFHIYRFQGIPQPADSYSIEFYGETMERISDRLQELYSRDATQAVEFCKAMHGFWACYWKQSAQATLTLDSETLREWLAENRTQDLNVFLFPPEPRPPMPMNDIEYAEATKVVAMEMKEQTNQLYLEVGVFSK